MLVSKYLFVIFVLLFREDKFLGTRIKLFPLRDFHSFII